jgi:hypothetical protein
LRKWIGFAILWRAIKSRPCATESSKKNKVIKPGERVLVLMKGPRGNVVEGWERGAVFTDPRSAKADALKSCFAAALLLF